MVKRRENALWTLASHKALCSAICSSCVTSTTIAASVKSSQSVYKWWCAIFIDPHIQWTHCILNIFNTTWEVANNRGISFNTKNSHPLWNDQNNIFYDLNNETMEQYQPLPWHHHLYRSIECHSFIASKTTKATYTQGILKRNRRMCLINIKRTAYIALVRGPILSEGGGLLQN